MSELRVLGADVASLLAVRRELLAHAEDLRALSLHSNAIESLEVEKDPGCGEGEGANERVVARLAAMPPQMRCRPLTIVAATLADLDLSSNRLTSMVGIEDCTALRTLNLASNRVRRRRSTRWRATAGARFSPRALLARLC